MFAKVLNSLAARHKFGLSATVHRADGMIKATFALLGDIVYSVPESEVAHKTMRVGIKSIATGVKLTRECLNTDGTKNYTKIINYLANNVHRNTLIRNYILGESDKSWLVLSDRLEQLETLMNLLPSHLRDKAVMISGNMTTKKGKAEREKALEDMRNSDKKYLFATYSLAAEGMDIPNLERLAMATPIKDYARVVQSIGRIARTYPSKANPICYDFVDAMDYTEKLFKHRLRHYRKGGCYICEEPTE
jgi:superfamily II DNA or RNA helicase